MRPTRPALLIGIFAGLLVMGFALGRMIDSITGSKPSVPWVTAGLTAFLVVVMLAARSTVRRWVNDRAFDGIDALRAARMLVLAKAGAVFGAAMAGVYGGFALLAVGDLNTAYGRDIVLRCGLTALAGLACAIAALALERACQVPPPESTTPPAPPAPPAPSRA